MSEGILIYCDVTTTQESDIEELTEAIIKLGWIPKTMKIDDSEY